MNNSFVQKITISFILLCCLLPFANKAFHIDDPLFLWTAKQIINNPSGFYDFTVNWYDYSMPMHKVMKNPPLVSYYIAVISKIFGFNEVAMHLFFYVPFCKNNRRLRLIHHQSLICQGYPSGNCRVIQRALPIFGQLDLDPG